MIRRLGAEPFEIRQRRDLDQVMDGLILPGGESTTILKLLQDLELYHPILQKIQQGLPTFGTCAGLILLSHSVIGETRPFFNVIDIRVKRNAFGRQLGSFKARKSFHGKEIDMVFIRAPYIESAGPDVEILASFDGMIMAARQANVLVTAFHPELTTDLTVHQYFLGMMA